MSPDPRPVLDRTLAQVGALAEAARAGDLDRPTPCAGWDLRTLLGHLVAVQWKVAEAGAGHDPSGLPFVAAVRDGDHALALAEGRDTIATVRADDAVLDATSTLDDDLAEATLDGAHRLAPAEPRGGEVPFGPPVRVGDDAGPYVRLVGWLGREP